MTYDSACYDLVRHFLGNLAPEKSAAELAQHIQTEIEDWINYRLREAAATSPNAPTGDASEGHAKAGKEGE